MWCGDACRDSAQWLGWRASAGRHLSPTRSSGAFLVQRVNTALILGLPAGGVALLTDGAGMNV